MPVTSTSFSKDGPKPKARGVDKRTLLLNAIKSEMGLDEEGYYKEIVKQSFWQGNEFLKKEILARLYVPYKATLPAINLDIPDGATLEDKVNIVISAVSDGSLTPDVGDMLLRMLKMTVEIKEKSEMQARIEAIEAILKGENATVKD